MYFTFLIVLSFLYPTYTKSLCKYPLSPFQKKGSKESPKSLHKKNIFSLNSLSCPDTTLKLIFRVRMGGGGVEGLVYFTTKLR